MSSRSCCSAGARRHIASGLAAILNATTPICGVVARIVHRSTSDEPAPVARRAGRLRRRRGDDRPEPVSGDGTMLCAQLACIVASFLYALAGGIRAAVPAARRVADAAHHRPADRRRGDDRADHAASVDRPDPGCCRRSRPGARCSLWHLLCSAFAYVLFFRLIDRAGATNSMLVTLLVPPIAILLGAIVLGEDLGAAGFRRPRADRGRPRGHRRPAAQPVGAARRLRPAA